MTDEEIEKLAKAIVKNELKSLGVDKTDLKTIVRAWFQVNNDISAIEQNNFILPYNHPLVRKRGDLVKDMWDAVNE